MLRNQPLFLLIIGLFFGVGFGFLIAANQGVTLESHNHATPAAGDPAHVHKAHDHGPAIEIAAGPNAPSVSLMLHKDVKGGWNVHIIPKNFRFTPQSVNQANVSGEGHAHIYVNGVKFARVYAEWFHFSELPQGETTVSVTLNANDHSEFSVAGDRVMAQQSIMVQ